MLLLAALALVVQVTPAPPAAADDIVVVGQRLRELDIVLKTDRKTGGYYCKFRRRTSDPALDALMCGFAIDCANSVETWKHYRGCIEPKVAAYVRDLSVNGRGGGK